MSIKIKNLIGAVAILAAGTLTAIPASAEEHVFRLTHHLSPKALAHAKFLQPWADRINKQSNGRIKIDIYPAMQLGGKPGDIYSQVRDGVADLGWTLPGYSAGLFPITEVFELPFVAGSAVATSPAIMEFYDEYLQKEWSDVKVLVMHATAPGNLYTVNTPVNSVADIKGMKIRAPSANGVKAIKALGAAPIGMPVPKVYEALSRGVVEGALLPWTIMRPTRIYEVTGHATEMGILASTFALFMNKDSYNSLPDDLKKVIDDNAGIPLAKQAGVLWDKDELSARKTAVDAGIKIVTLNQEQIADWKNATQPVIDAWVANMNSRGLPGEKMLAKVQALIKKYESQ